MNSRLRRILAGLAAAAGLMQCAAAAADGARAPLSPPSPKYKEECGACHVAYPAGLLPAASWQRLMAGLPKHFGTDASLEPALAKEISAWLAANAGTYKRVREMPPEDRITRSAWFLRKHDEVAAATWKLPAVKSAANCAACHPQADQGDFNERSIRIPR
jgi:hypothetical protein